MGGSNSAVVAGQLLDVPRGYFDKHLLFHLATAYTLTRSGLPIVFLGGHKAVILALGQPLQLVGKRELGAIFHIVVEGTVDQLVVVENEI